jgi:hypothetical protein
MFAPMTGFFQASEELQAAPAPAAPAEESEREHEEQRQEQDVSRAEQIDGGCDEQADYE